MTGIRNSPVLTALANSACAGQRSCETRARPPPFIPRRCLLTEQQGPEPNLSLDYTGIPKKVAVKEAELLELRLAPPHPPPCSYFVPPMTECEGKAGSGLEKVIRCGKRKPTLVLGLTPPYRHCRWKIAKSCVTWIFLWFCVGDGRAGGFLAKHGHAHGDRVGE